MQNSDLLAWFEPVPNHFYGAEWHDVTGGIQDIQETDGKLSFRTCLPAGIYRGVLTTKPGAFDMGTAGIELVRAPDGKRVLLGPWDLNHLDNVMAIPMALVTVNGRFRGGLWFSMPGAEEIRQGMLRADFGFEHEGGNLEVVLELPPEEQKRLQWSSLEAFELRKDDRRFTALVPVANRAKEVARVPREPRFFTAGQDRKGLYKKLHAHPGFHAVRALLDAPTSQWSIFYEQNQSHFELACLIGYATEDQEILNKAVQCLIKLCSESTWSGRPNPLLMGGDNDRGVGYRLAVVGVGWEFLRTYLNEEQKEIVLSKAEEYLRKMYDFTLLQRGYMGCPSPDPHSLGTWWGVGIACMAFHDDLSIAAKALPFFHGLMLDSLSLMPSSGKCGWVTFFPIWLVRYLTAAIEFGGPLQEVEESEFLDQLTGALLSSFLAPNAQEIQRGLRTVEHRVLTAFLSFFHPSSAASSAYATFVEVENRQAGNVFWGLFDFLYGSSSSHPTEKFSSEPYFARDTGEVILADLGAHKLSFSISGGIKQGAECAFRLKPHNREADRSMGDLTLSMQGAPVITKIQGSYGLFSAQRNALCFEDGCGVSEGQYLNGNTPPEYDSFIRRLWFGERFVYLDINITRAIRSDLGIRFAQRICVVDRKTSAIVIRDVFEAQSDLQASTHLHCSGSATKIAEDLFRLTGGQAKAIAGIKYGDLGLSDEEVGEIFVKILDVSHPWQVTIEEPEWIPAYIYGVNAYSGKSIYSIHETSDKTKEDDLSHVPKMTRWKLGMEGRVQQGEFLFALSPDAQTLPEVAEDGGILFSDGARFWMGGEMKGNGWSCEAEAVLMEGDHLAMMGARSFTLLNGNADFTFPVDVRGALNERKGYVHAPGEHPVRASKEIDWGTSSHHPHHSHSLWKWEIPFHLAGV